MATSSTPASTPVHHGERPAGKPDARTSDNAAPLVRHTAPAGASSAALAMGVQYRTDCGVWRWPTGRVSSIRTLSDLAPNSCPLCAAALTSRVAR